MITVIVNPVAGTGLALTVGQKVDSILTERGIAHTMLYTKGVGHATELARDAVRQGVTTVLSVGGDGTLSETAAGLVGSKTALGIIPAGPATIYKVIGPPRNGMKRWIMC